MAFRRLAIAAAFTIATAAVLGGPAAAAGSTTIYNNIPHPLPGNLPSVSYEATGTSEFGDRVAFAGTARGLTSVTVTMSSWACQSGHWTSGDCATAHGAKFSHPITLNLYAAVSPNLVGPLIGTTTQTFAMPYRPSADPINCTGTSAGKWYDKTSKTCFNGKAFTIRFNLASHHLVLPDQVIFGVAYNTTDYGYAPIGPMPCSTTAAGCAYDSLNVAVADPATSLSAGSDPAPSDAYQDTLYDSCTNGSIKPFGLDAGCWTGLKPAVRFIAAKGDNGDNGDNSHNSDSFDNSDTSDNSD
jgi:hypothetical protein